MHLYHIQRNTKHCGVCGSEKILLNRSSTSFCGECKYDITRGGNIGRMVDHPLYEKYGPYISQNDPDYQELLARKGIR